MHTRHYMPYIIGPLSLLTKLPKKSDFLSLTDDAGWTVDRNAAFVKAMIASINSGGPAGLLLPPGKTADQLALCCERATPGGPPRVLTVELLQLLVAGVRFVRLPASAEPLPGASGSSFSCVWLFSPDRLPRIDGCVDVTETVRAIADASA